MKRLFFVLLAFIILLTTNCNKETHSRVKYTVNCSSPFTVQYTMNGRSFSISEETGSWSVSFRARVGNEYFLSASKISPFTNMSVSVSIDGDVFDEVSTRNTLPIVLTGIIP